VNLASRLEGVNKMYGTNIIISEHTKEKIGEEFFTREIDTIRVKGKTQAIRIYELLDRVLINDEPFRRCIEHMQKDCDIIKMVNFVTQLFHFNQGNHSRLMMAPRIHSLKNVTSI